MDYGKIKIHNLKDKEIGKRIKAFSRMFFFMQLFMFCIYCLFLFIFIPYTLNKLNYDGIEIFFIMIITGSFLYILFMSIYFMFLRNVGFGILVQDNNEIKNNLINNIEDLYCTECNNKVSIADKECPHCGAIFEE